MLSIILSVSRKHWPVRIQAALVISYYSCIVIEGTTPGVGQGKELLLSVEDGVHPNPIAHRLVQTARDPLHMCASCAVEIGLLASLLIKRVWTCET